MASATPNVESLFDVNDSCFASVSQIIDLSFSIPSLGSILSSAQDAVLKYAQKKVCSTVGKVSGMVTSICTSAVPLVGMRPLTKSCPERGERMSRLSTSTPAEPKWIVDGCTLAYVTVSKRSRRSSSRRSLRCLLRTYAAFSAYVRDESWRIASLNVPFGFRYAVLSVTVSSAKPPATSCVPTWTPSSPI